MTAKLPELPPLPEMVAAFRCYESRDIAEVKVYSELLRNGDRLYTADQMRAYAEAAVLAERERCAKLPELPEPFGWLHDANGNDPLTFVRGPLPQMLGLVSSTLAVYTPDQLQAAVLAERERCAKLCESHHANGRRKYDHADECAAAIRNPTQEG